MNKRTLLAFAVMLLLTTLLVTGLMLTTNQIMMKHIDIVFPVQH